MQIANKVDESLNVHSNSIYNSLCNGVLNHLHFQFWMKLKIYTYIAGGDVHKWRCIVCINFWYLSFVVSFNIPTIWQFAVPAIQYRTTFMDVLHIVMETCIIYYSSYFCAYCSASHLHILTFLRRANISHIWKHNNIKLAHKVTESNTFPAIAYTYSWIYFNILTTKKK